MSDRLNIYLLGGLRVEHEGREIVRFRTKKTASLLAYLAFHAPRPIPREVLIEQFWPDNAAEKSRASLNTAISSLRAQLGVFATLPEPLILADRHSVRLNDSLLWTDVAAFRQAAALALDRSSGVQEAIGLYRGDLLEGFYDEWIMPHAAELSELLGQVKRLPIVRELKPPTIQTAPRTNLPRLANAFVGRDADIARLLDLREAHPLVSILGIGGVGKSRIAIELGKHLLTDVWLVAFAGSAADVSITDEIVRQLGLSRDPSIDPIELLAARFASSSPTLILDNLEHLTGVERDLPILIDGLRTTKFIVTSRIRLNLGNETVFMLEPLQVPGAESDLESLRHNAAVALFASRSAASAPGFTVNSSNAGAVRLLCQKLEGISLLIELAAARANVFSVREMVEQMERPLEFLVTRAKDRSERHRSARSAMDWSYRILSSQARALFPKLALARGGWSLRSALQVLEDRELEDTLQELIESSLLRSTTFGDTIRFTMHAVLREFGLELLGPTEAETVQDRRLAHLTSLAGSEGSKLQGSRSKEWFDALSTEVENIRDCLDWAWQNGREVEAADLTTRLSPFWERRVYWKEAVGWLEQMLGFPGLSVPLKARLHHAAGIHSRWLADYKTSRARYLEASNLFKGLGDRIGVADVKWSLGALEATEGDFDAAERCFREALTEIDRCGAAENPGLLLNLGMIEFERFRQESSDEFCSRALAVALSQSDSFTVGRILVQQGDALIRYRRLDEVRPLLEKAIATFRDLGDPLWLGVALCGLARAQYLRGEYDVSADLYRTALKVAEELGDGLLWASIQTEKARAAMHLGDEEGAEALLREALAVFNRYKYSQRAAEADLMLALLAWPKNQAEAVLRINSALVALARDMLSVELHCALLVVAEFAVARGLADEAAAIAGAARTFFGSLGIAPDPSIEARLGHWLKGGESSVNSPQAWELAMDVVARLGHLDQVVSTVPGFLSVNRNGGFQPELELG